MIPEFFICTQSVLSKNFRFDNRAPCSNVRRLRVKKADCEEKKLGFASSGWWNLHTLFFWRNRWK